MGLFTFNYSKPGPGVSKDAPRKKNVFLYFELFGRKFIKLLQASWIHCLCSIPYLVIMFLFIDMFFGSYIQNLLAVVLQGQSSADEINLLLFVVCSFLTCVIFVLWGSGPSSAGFAYITRCFVREEHAWILTDYLEKFKENFKQSMILVVLDFVMLYLLGNAIIQYWILYSSQNQLLWMMLLYISVLMLIIYTFMHAPAYQVMVTYDCKFKQLLKNSAFLALGRAPINLVLACICVVVLWLLFNYFQPFVAILAVVALLFGFLRFPLEFNSARMIQKVMKSSKGK